MIQQSENYSLLAHNTFGIDVRTLHFIEYDSVEELRQLINNGNITPPYLHIGQGSNLLFTCDYDGTVLHSRIIDIEIVRETDEEVLVKVGSGIIWDDFVAYCVGNKWYGAENLSNIPGEVGASAVQNIGAYGVEVKDLIAAVGTINMNGIEHTYYPEDCKFGYRHSIFKEPGMQDIIVTYVTYRLSKNELFKLDYGTIRQELSKYTEVTQENVRQAVIDIRAAKLPDPKVLGNAGSFFMNPVVPRAKLLELQSLYPEIPFYEMGDDKIKIPAGWLIEKSGWKGKSLGLAKVHDKQALVLVNTGGAAGKDIIALSDAVRSDVKEMFGIEIRPEVKFI